MLSFHHGIWKHKNLATWGAEKLCVLIESPGKKKSFRVFSYLIGSQTLLQQHTHDVRFTFATTFQ